MWSSRIGSPALTPEGMITPVFEQPNPTMVYEQLPQGTPAQAVMLTDAGPGCVSHMSSAGPGLKPQAQTPLLGGHAGKPPAASSLPEEGQLGIMGSQRIPPLHPDVVRLVKPGLLDQSTRNLVLIGKVAPEGTGPVMVQVGSAVTVTPQAPDCPALVTVTVFAGGIAEE